MRASISDVHNSHGSVFTLGLETQNSNDIEVMDFLRKQDAQINDTKYGRRFFYNYLFLVKGFCRIGFMEAGMCMAKIDGRSHISRKDQKFPVIELEHLHDEVADARTHDIFNPATCHWCTKGVFGVHRYSIEVMVKTEKGFENKRVDVHKECQVIREAQMAMIPFPLEALSK